MLHECFRFKQPSSVQLEPLMEALHILIGIIIAAFVTVVGDCYCCSCCYGYHHTLTHDRS